MERLEKEREGALPGQPDAAASATPPAQTPQP